jgi:acetylglutamate kinase
MGDEIGLVAERIAELGHVGDALPSRPPAVESALELGLIPVVAPLAEGPLNVNADDAAAALAVGLGADRILFVSDVPGVLLDDEVVPELEAALDRGLELTPPAGQLVALPTYTAMLALRDVVAKRGHVRPYWQPT